jgi:hypothetical protein
VEWVQEEGLSRGTEKRREEKRKLRLPPYLYKHLRNDGINGRILQTFSIGFFHGAGKGD